MSGKNGGAISTFSKILEIDPTDGWACVHMAFAVKAEGRVSNN